MAREAFVTLATNDRYCEGALVVAQSLRRHKTRREIVVLITPQVSTICRSRLSVLFDHVIVVDVLDSNDDAHLALLHRPELGVTFTKLHCWRLVQYTKCVFLDADTLVLTNVDELFERNELSASPDAGWPDMFNSGVFVFTPSMETYNNLIKLADTDGSFDGGDQGLLNSYFSEWSTSDTSKRLSFLYNMHSTATYTYSPAFAQYGKDTKIVHFIGFVKPWNHKYDEKTGEVTQVDGPGIHEETLVKQWWKVWAEVQGLEGMRKTTTIEYKGAENPPNYGGQPDSVHEVKKEAQAKLESQKQHLQQWQSSNVDYAGADSFDHIQAKLDTVLQLDDTEDEVNETADLPPPDSNLESSDVGSNETTLDESTNTPTIAADEVEEDSITIVSLIDQPYEHYMRWTKGLIDYHGVDSFDNIKAKIDMVTWSNLVQPVYGADISDDDDVTSSDDAISLNEVIGSDDVASVNELAKVNDVIMVPEVTKFTDVTVSNFIDVTTTNA